VDCENKDKNIRPKGLTYEKKGAAEKLAAPFLVRRFLIKKHAEEKRQQSCRTP
jgi:hypothetical protein